jgi:hypothetical protein
VASSSPETAPAPRLLLVDDNRLNRRIVRAMLDGACMTIVDAENGQQALDLLAGGGFDLVLLDMHMPVMDGAETLRRIRASREAWSRVPIVVLTADGMASAKERYVSLGADGYLGKPVDPACLLAEIRAVLSSRAASNATAA